MDFHSITSDQTFQADYYLRDPEVFKISNSTNSGQYWLIETRNFNATMTVGTTTTVDYNYYLLRSHYANAPNQGVLVWKVDGSGSWGSALHADGKPWPASLLISAGDPFPGTGNVKVLSPWSDSRLFPYYVPNTKPSTNVGMEITNEGTNYYLIDFYALYPTNASPSKPQNVQLSSNSGQYGNIRFSWAANQESDLASYEVSRKVDLYGNVWEVMVPSTTITYWVDPEYLYAPGGGDFRPTYRVRAKDTQGLFSVYSDEVSVRAEQGKISVASSHKPSTYSLSQNFPNPFNPSTHIKFEIPEDQHVVLKVFNTLGQEVATLVNGFQSAGSYSVPFDASQLSSGVYIYTLKAGHYTASKKLLLMR